MAKWIAEQSFDCIDARGKRCRVVARIGEPEMMPREGELSAYGRCRVSLEPLAAVRSAGGVDKFQALCVALHFIRTALKAFVAQGGRVTHPSDGSPIDLDDPSFCPYIDLRQLRTRPKKRMRRR